MLLVIVQMWSNNTAQWHSDST